MTKLNEFCLEVISRYSEGIRLDQPIYRVFKIDYLIDDYKNSTLTFPQISTENWGNETGENPLKFKKYRMNDGEIVNIDTLLNDYYGSCWSLNSESQYSFREFNQHHDSVRIKSTVGKILNNLILEKERFKELHYHVGAINYKTELEIDEWIKLPLDYHLDSLGIGLVKSLLILPDKFNLEREIRFVYLYQPQDNPLVQANVKLDGLFCRHTFDWANIIDEIEFDFNIDLDAISGQKAKLRQANMNVIFKN